MTTSELFVSSFQLLFPPLQWMGLVARSLGISQFQSLVAANGVFFVRGHSAGFQATYGLAVLVKAATLIQSDTADGREGTGFLPATKHALPGRAFLTKCGPGNFTWWGAVMHYLVQTLGMGWLWKTPEQLSRLQTRSTTPWGGCMFRKGLKGNRSPHHWLGKTSGSETSLARRAIGVTDFCIKLQDTPYFLVHLMCCSLRHLSTTP